MLNKLLIVFLTLACYGFGQTTVIGSYETRPHFGTITYLTCTTYYIDFSGNLRSINNETLQYRVWTPFFDYVEYEYVANDPPDALPNSVFHEVWIHTSGGYTVVHRR